MFVDEKWWRLGEGERNLFWCFGTEKPPKRNKPLHPLEFRILGGMSRKGVAPLQIVKPGDTIDAVWYRKHLGNLIKWGCSKHRNRLGLLQDNASPHKANETLQFITEQIKTPVLKHPPYSPDLNPIETLWAITQKWVGKEKPKTRPAMQVVVVRVVENVSVEICGKIVDSFMRRIRAVYECGGGWPGGEEVLDLPECKLK